MLLFTPGPTPIPESIRQAMATPTLHHRTKEFEAIFAKARLGLKTMLKMPEVLMLASSGTGAMEASVLQLCRTKLLSVNCGKFGQRWGKIAQKNGVPFTEIVHEWDTPASAQEVIDALKADSSIDAVALQVCESAGGLRQPAEEIAKAIKAHDKNIVVIADAITAMGVESIDTTHIDALIGGSQKAFMLPPGLSVVGLSSYALELCEGKKSEGAKSEGVKSARAWNSGLYFDFATELKNQRKNTTAWTAPTTIICGLVRYFEIVQAMGNGADLDSALDSTTLESSLQEAALEKGLESAYAHTKRLALAARAAVKELSKDSAGKPSGIAMYPHAPALAMSAIHHDTHAAQIRQKMKAYGVNVAAGQDHIKEKIFRINHMGLVRAFEASFVINALELSLDALGLRKFDGKGNAAFIKALYEV